MSFAETCYYYSFEYNQSPENIDEILYVEKILSSNIVYVWIKLYVS